MLQQLFTQALGLASPWQVDNSALQAAKQRARGFTTPQNFIAIIYLITVRLSHLPSNPMRTSGAIIPHFA